MDWYTYAASLQVTDNDTVVIGNGGNGGAGGAGGNGGNGGNGGTFNGNVSVDTGNHFDLGDYFHPVHVEACLPPSPPPPPSFDLTLTDNDNVIIGNGGNGGAGGEHGNGGNGGNGGTFNGDITVNTGNALVGAMLAHTLPAHAQTGFHISDGRLVDSAGNDFVLRGVSHAHTWFTEETDSLANIKSLGANSVRVVLSSGDYWDENSVDDVANVVDECKANRLICMLEVHDTTGYGEQSGASTLDQAVDYWIELKSVLQGEEDYVLINIGNEPYGNDSATVARWASDTSAAIQRLRAAGFEHTLVVDAPNWGQDWTNTMRNNADQVYASDPTGNTVFSIHMYGVYSQASTITSYLEHFVNAGLPLIIGPDANRQTAQLEQLMEAAPSLKPMLTGGSWVGGRRWDILFQSGETLALPEGDAEARAAIAKFAKMDQVASLLGRGFRRFDMRVPGRFYARTDGGPGSVAAPIVPVGSPVSVVFKQACGPDLAAP